MKRTSSDLIPRNLIPPTSSQQSQQPNIQTIPSNPEHNPGTPPQYSQKPSLDRSNFFNVAQGTVHQLEITNLQIINSNGENIIPPILSHCVNADLANALLRQDFVTAMRITGVSTLQISCALISQIRRASLMFAAKWGNSEIIKILLSGVIDPDALACMKDVNGMTALMHAVKNGHSESIKVLLSGVKDPDALACMKDVNGMTALIYATEYSGQTLNAILSNVSNADKIIWMKNAKGMTVLHHAAKNGSNTTIQSLLDYAKNPAELIFFPDNNGKTALMLSTKNDNIDDVNVDIVTTILERATKVRDPYYRMSPQYKKGKTAYISIDRDALIFLKDSKGMNAFMYAIKYSNTHTMLKLFNLATDRLALITEKNNANKTALDLIDEEFCDRLIERLERDDSPDVDTLLAMLEERKSRFRQAH